METKTLERETANGIIIVNAQNVAHMQGRGGFSAYQLRVKSDGTTFIFSNGVMATFSCDADGDVYVELYDRCDTSKYRGAIYLNDIPNWEVTIEK